jgi:SNF2 family DNA or RNA helicase
MPSTCLTRNDLLPYQNRIVDFIKRHEACALWVDMGLGKTVSTETAYLDLLNSFDARRMLVVAPKRVARKVWSDEIKKWSHLNGLTISCATGDNPKKRWNALKVPADIHTIGRDNVGWLAAQFIQGRKQVRRFPWDVIVLDESQSFKHQGTARWKAMRDLRRLTQRMVQLTGTPSPNGYGDLWGQFKLLDYGQRLGHSEKAFRDRWFDAEANMGGYPDWIMRETAAKEIEAAVADITLSLLSEDYLDMQPVVYNPVRCEVPKAALALYKKLAREYIVQHGGNTINAVNAAACAGKLAQLANGAVYHDDKGNWTHVHDSKLFTLRELLEDLNGPAIIVYGFKHDKARLEKLLQETGKRWRTLDTERDEDDWNAGKLDYLLLHPQSAGHGLNLQGAGSETLIWFGLTNNREHYDQANARLIGGHRRAGRNVVIHHIIADGTIDDYLMDLLKTKGMVEHGLKRAISQLSATL